MKLLNNYLLLPLICTIVLAVGPVTYADDGCSSAGFNVATTINLTATPFGIAVADFNSDGHLDLVAAPNNVSTEILLLLGRGGTERFGPPTSFPAGGEPRRISVGDFNGDGKPDVAITLDNSFGLPSGRLSVLLNDGTGKFGAPIITNTPGDPVKAVPGDVNNDGKLDIVTGLFTGSSDATVTVLLGNGAGGFTPAAGSPFASFSRNNAEVVIADFNEDGKPDLALPGSSVGIDIFAGDGTGAFAAGVHVAGSGGLLSLTAGDFNEDGHLDLLCDNQMHLGTGTGTFGAPIVVAVPLDTNAAIAGNVNNDSHLDVVVGGIGGLSILLGNGTGNLVLGKSYASGLTVFGASSLFTVLADFNEDGKTDLAGVQPKGIGILDGDGTGAFKDALSYHTTIQQPRYLLAADFNNDGKQDFITASGAFLPVGSSIEVALGDGAGGFIKNL